LLHLNTSNTFNRHIQLFIFIHSFSNDTLNRSRTKPACEVIDSSLSNHIRKVSEVHHWTVRRRAFPASSRGNWVSKQGVSTKGN